MNKQEKEGEDPLLSNQISNNQEEAALIGVRSKLYESLVIDEFRKFSHPSPTAYSQEINYLFHLLAALNTKGLSIKDPNACSLSDDQSQFKEVGSILMSELDPDIKRIKIIKGKVGVWVKYNGLFKKVAILEEGAIIGGGDRSWLSADEIPNGLFRLIVEDSYVSNANPNSNQYKLNQSFDSLVNSTFTHFIDELSFEDSGLSSVLDAYFTDLRQVSDQFKYTKTINELSLAGLQIESSNFQRLLQVAIRKLSIAKTNYQQGARIVYMDDSMEFTQSSFNRSVLLPALLSEISILSSNMSIEAAQALNCEVLSIFNQQYCSKSGRSIPFQFDLIENLDSSHNKLNTQPEIANIELSDSANDLLNFIHLASDFAIPDIINQYMLDHLSLADQPDLINELKSADLIKVELNQLLLSELGLNYIKSNFSEINSFKTDLYLFNSFLDSQDFFLAIKMLKRIREVHSNESLDIGENCDLLIKNIIQVPHPFLPQDFQLSGLMMLSEILDNEHEFQENIKFAIILASYLSAKDFITTQKLALNYIKNYVGSSKNTDYDDRFITLYYIYLSVSTTLEKWSDITNFRESYIVPITEGENSALFSQVLSPDEARLWIFYADQRAFIIQQASDEKELCQLAAASARFLDKKMPSKEASLKMNDLSLHMIDLTLQQLYLMTYENGNELQRQLAIEKAIDYGLRMAKRADKINPIFLWSGLWNTAKAYRAIGNYEESLRFAGMAAIDPRGESRELMQYVVILGAVLTKFISTLKEDNIDDMMSNARQLMRIIEHLSDKNKKDTIPAMVKRAIDPVINKLKFIINDQHSADEIKRIQPEIEVIIWGVSCSLCEISLRKANQAGTPHEKLLASGNYLDVLILMKKALIRLGEDGETPDYLKYFLSLALLSAMVDCCLKQDEIFLEHYIDSYKTVDTLRQVLENFIFLNRLQLLKWLRSDDGKENDHFIYLLEKSQLRYRLILNEDKKLFNGHLPKGLRKGDMSRMINRVESYKKRVL